MIDKAKINRLIEECRKIDINDPAISDHWDLMVQELSTESDAIDFLSAADDSDLNVLSPIFEDLSLKFQSSRFIEFLTDLSQKHPAADMNLDIEFAKKALSD